MGQPFSHKLFSPDAERYFNHNGPDQSVSVSVGHMVTDSIVLPDSLANIPDMLFGDCTSLVNMTLGNAATSVSTVAFHGCTIKLFTILATVLTIGDCVFYECDMLENVIFEEYEGWYISPDEGATPETHLISLILSRTPNISRSPMPTVTGMLRQSEHWISTNN